LSVVNVVVAYQCKFDYFVGKVTIKVTINVTIKMALTLSFNDDNVELLVQDTEYGTREVTVDSMLESKMVTLNRPTKEGIENKVTFTMPDIWQDRGQLKSHELKSLVEDLFVNNVVNIKCFTRISDTVVSETNIHVVTTVAILQQVMGKYKYDSTSDKFWHEVHSSSNVEAFKYLVSTFGIIPLFFYNEQTSEYRVINDHVEDDKLVTLVTVLEKLYGKCQGANSKFPGPTFVVDQLTFDSLDTTKIVNIIQAVKLGSITHDRGMFSFANI